MSINSSSNISKSNTFTDSCFEAYTVHSSSTSFIANLTVLCFFNVLFCIAGIILNSLVLYIFLKSPRLKSKMAYFTIMVLSTNDLAVVTIAQPLLVTILCKVILKKWESLCVYVVSFGLTSSLFPGMAVSTLFVINIERYFSIVRPFLYLSIVNKRRFLLCCLCCWLLSTLHLIFSKIWTPNIGWIFIGIALFLVCSTTVFIYISIFLLARKKLCGVKPENREDKDTSRNLMSFLRELKLAKTYVLIICLNFCCYLPTGVLALYYFIAGTAADRISKIEQIFHIWAITFLLMNSTLNSLLFFWRNRELRKESSRVFKKLFSVWDG